MGIAIDAKMSLMMSVKKRSTLFAIITTTKQHDDPTLRAIFEERKVKQIQ